MDKIKINNQVVLMRKYVIQAKTRVIHKCIREIRLLQNRKGDENQVLKCKRKAERLILEVNLLKKIKPDAVSKMALSKSKDWKAILNQKNASLEDRCFAILANYEPVQTEVEKFYSANSYLVPKIPALVQEWDERVKHTPQKKEKAFKKNDAFAISTKETENLNEGQNLKIEEKPEIENTQKSSQQKLNNVPKTNNKITGNNLSSCGTNSSGDEEGNSSLSDLEEGEKKSSLSDLGDGEKNSSLSDLEEGEKNSSLSDLEDGEENSSLSELEDDETSSLSGHEDEDRCNRSPQKTFASINTAVKAERSKFKVQSVKNMLSHPKKPSGKVNKTNKQPDFQNKFSVESNSAKAVALLNLNEMLDMDEIPIENNKTIVKTVEESSKRNRDSFFLSANSEDFSENEGHEDPDDSREETNRPLFRKKHCYDFNKKDSYNNRFKNEGSSFRGKRNSGNFPQSQNFGFRKNSFQKDNKDFHSEGKSYNFKRNGGREENNFNKNRSNNFNRTKEGQDGPFNRNRFNNFERKDGRKECAFNKGKFNNFEKREGIQDGQFNKNKPWNTPDKSNKMEPKPFKSASKPYDI